MYVYLMKCSNFYKIGFSKNPSNRLKTVRTHNPLKVEILATLKTDSYLLIEKELHDKFATSQTRGEWFELNEDHLLLLKIDYGFSFKKSINRVSVKESINDTVLSELKEIRIDNSKIDYFKGYFEDLFNCDITNIRNLKRCCIKFETILIKKAIDNLFSQDKSPNVSYNLLYKVCSNIVESTEYPSKYFCKVLAAILYNHYNISMSEDLKESVINNFNEGVDIDDAIKTINTKKFFMNQEDFLEFVYDKYTADEWI